MAAKKKQQLTIEEKLKQALVPKEEQPYKIPDNWCWVKLLESFNNKTDSKKKIKQKDYLGVGKYPIVDQGQSLIGGYTNDENMLILVKKPIIIFGDHTRCIKYINFDFVQGADGTKVLEPKNFFYDKYFYYAFKNVNIPNLGYRRHFPMFDRLKIPLAPLNEQQRIVDIIENLFAKLDEAKALIQNTIDKFEQNKMAILHKAFTGELTANWRDENNLTLDTWKKTIMQNVCEKIVCGKTPTGYISDTGEIPYLKVYNIVDNGINFEKTPQFIPKEIHKEKLKSSILKPNDVIMNIVGPPLRKIAIIPNDYPEWNMNQAIVRFRAKRDILYKFLYYILIYPKTLDEVINKTKGVVGQANISITQSRNLEIELPTIEEQQEIVDILDKIFAKYDKIRDLKEQLEKIELLKKSILAKAFRGELGTNNPNEESAEVLLKSILNDKDI